MPYGGARRSGEDGMSTMTEPDLTELRRRAEQGDDDAAGELVELAGARGDLEELRRLADAGNRDAADVLLELTEDDE